MPKPDGPLTAVVISGGKQYRVAAGDRIVGDRVAAEPGSELTLSKVLFVADSDEVKVGPSALGGVSVLARVIGHQRGPKIEAFRYKAKKRVRVHRGSRAELTALEILEIGGKGRAKSKPAEETAEPEQKKSRTRKAAPTAVAVETESETEPKAEAKPARPARTRTRKAAEEKAEEEDGS